MNADVGTNRKLLTGLKWTLNTAWYLHIVGGVVLVLLALYTMMAGSLGFDFEVPVVFTPDPSTYSIGTKGATIAHAEGTLTVVDPSETLVVITALSGLLWVALTLVVIYQLRKVLASVAAREPFSGENARRIRVMGLAVVIGVFGHALVRYIQTALVSEAFAAQGVTLGNSFNLEIPMLITGLIVIVLSDVFRRGAELQRDQELTV